MENDKKACFPLFTPRNIWGDSNKYPQHMFPGVLNSILKYLQISASSWAKESVHSNCRCNEFCRYIECRHKEVWLYMVRLRNLLHVTTMVFFPNRNFLSAEISLLKNEDLSLSLSLSLSLKDISQEGCIDWLRKSNPGLRPHKKIIMGR